MGSYAPMRITETYVASTGNHFLYNDPLGDGKPRNGLVDITLTEPRPGVGVYSFGIPGNARLDPLWDIAVSPLTFTLKSHCATFSEPSFRLTWFSPDSKQNIAAFLANTDEDTTIGSFAWSASEVSASDNYWTPYIADLHLDSFSWTSIFGSSFQPGAAQVSGDLVPGVANQQMLEIWDDQDNCGNAYVRYTITYTPRWYPFL
jgi:hypothetical protein